jgi:predicted RNA-binding protein with TRAM domain
MNSLDPMPVLSIWLYLPRQNKVEILIPVYYTERSNLEDSSGYGGDSGYRGSGGGYGGGSRGFGGQGRFGGPRPFRPSPVRVGEEYDVKIESMSKRGDSGVARVQGLVIFVAGTNVGDSVKVRITKVGRGYATAEVADQAVAREAMTETQAAEESKGGDMDSSGEEETQ